MNKESSLLAKVFVLPVFLLLSFSIIFLEIGLLSGSEKISAVFGSNSDVKIAKAADFENNMVMEGRAVSGDARPLMIKKYLEKYNSPLAPYSDLIFELSEQYGFEYYWIVAIAQQESNLCKKAPEGTHNCWGYGIHKRGTLGFDNYELALKSYAEYLDREYFKKGRTTTEDIMKKYCPSSDGSWARGVNQFIEQLKTGNF